MYINSSVFLAIAATTVLAAPAPILINRDSKPPNQCATKGGSVSNFWGVYMNDNLMSSAQGTGDWAGGFLDNLRGRCGSITNWQAIPDNSGGIACSFNTSKFCQAYDVAAALHAASGEWVYCEGLTMNDLFDSAGNIIEGFMGVLGDAASIVEPFV
ncbi:hypothetical protein AUEXF2481DRAFT_237844 [Aureobasidium subglaciale EXF-2481]|uniref:Ecp2 effector protein domain-containing protein n=1 Tax=Aureobasidium subglaciale (strain EXF-2481) TaxID=1043005 RepID=A0A074YBJ4_AURSE|nr:uncharacterized protein AUEXF2481DRAFT_237844 [Aureobasidium subglaciale EXF-2481]KEQ95133.1 hypothetical protein AUEXF2481DRAFT_237844 [Aureobasidium subglaciale EXF-2481]